LVFLEEAQKIGDLFLASSIADGQAWSETVHGEQGPAPGHSRFDLYAGAAGVQLLLLELYRLTGCERYRESVVPVLAWLQRNHGALAADALLTGRLGIGYTLGRAATILRQPDYLQQAIDLARSWTYRFTAVEPDYVAGLCGTLMGLLHLHAVSGEGFLLDDLEICAAAILDRARPGPKGLYFESNPQDVHGLCGLGHGAAGAALAWLTLGRYLNNEALIHFGLQALDYTLNYFDAGSSDWPDFRMHFTDEYEEAAHRAYLAGEWDHFNWPSFRNSWCNGAAGIGLVLLRAYRQTGHPDYLDKARAALNLTEADLVDEEGGGQEDILCHGRAGNAEIFLEAAEALRDVRFRAKAIRMGELILADRDRRGHFRNASGEAGLFTGLAGIGYFFCRLADPAGTPSLLAPTLEPRQDLVLSTATPTLAMTPALMRRHLLEKTFPRTLALLQVVRPDVLADWFERPLSPGTEAKAAFAACIEASLQGLDGHGGEVIRDVAALERTRAAVGDGVDANGRLFVKERLVRERLAHFLHIGDGDLAAIHLGNDPDLRLLQTHWDWSGDHPDAWRANFTAAPDDHWVLLLPRPRGVKEVHLSPLSAFLLNAFSVPNQVTEVLNRLAASLQAAPSEITSIRTTGLAQIRALLQAHFLVDSELATLHP